jgi:hypothetical protein
MSVLGLLRLLQLCQVSSSLSPFLNCNDRNAWKELLSISSERLTERSMGVLKSVAEVDAKISSTLVHNDHQAANIYKREFTRHVIYHALYDVFRSAVLGTDDVVFDLIWFRSQIETFLGRSNGSMKQVVEMIKQDMSRIRRRDPKFPPVPSDFYVGAVEIVAEVTNKKKGRRFYQAGRSRLHLLYTAIRETDYY